MRDIIEVLASLGTTVLTREDIVAMGRAPTWRNPKLVPEKFLIAGIHPFESLTFVLPFLFDDPEVFEALKSTVERLNSEDCADRGGKDPPDYGDAPTWGFASDTIAKALSRYDRNAPATCPMSRSEYEELLAQADLAVFGMPSDYLDRCPPSRRSFVIDLIAMNRSSAYYADDE
jgi:hypothetical protein